MRVKRARLKALANLPKQRLRIARPRFAAEGPRHALNRAAKMLGPFLGHRLDAVESPKRIETYSDALQACEALGHSYFRNLVEEQTAPRLPEVLKHLAAIQESSRALSTTLAHLSYAERYLLHRIWGIHPRSRQETLKKILEDMDDYGPPSTEDITDFDTLGPGLLAETLHLLEQYTGSLHYIIHRRYTRPGTTKVDAGGSTNAANVFAPNPRWHLIHECREVFCELPGHKIDAEDGTPFQQFVATIHEWVTGEKDVTLVGPLREYLKVWRQRCAKAAELEQLRVKGGYTDAQFAALIADTAVKSSVTGSIAGRARAIAGQIATLDDRLVHGHRIPARDIVTG